jgi:hypothetical protein
MRLLWSRKPLSFMLFFRYPTPLESCPRLQSSIFNKSCNLSKLVHKIGYLTQYQFAIVTIDFLKIYKIRENLLNPPHKWRSLPHSEVYYSHSLSNLKTLQMFMNNAG